MATNSVRTTLTTASGRSRDAILRTRGVDSRPHGWQTLYQGHGDSSLQPPGTSPSAPTDRDGDSRNCDDFDRPTSQANSRRQGSSQYNHCPPSALNPSRASAVSRAASYTPYKRPPSYSRSIVPDHEDDYLRLRRLANRGARLPREEYKPGLIIRAPLHEQDSRGDSRPLGSASSIGSCTSEATMAEKYTTPSRFGPIFTKYRKMIVVACHQDNYVAVVSR